MTTFRKSDPNFKYFKLLPSTRFDGSPLYIWVLFVVLISIAVSFFLILYSLDNLYSASDYDPINTEIFKTENVNENPIYFSNRVSSYSQASEIFKKNSFHSSLVLSSDNGPVALANDLKLFCYYSLPNNISDINLEPSQIDSSLCTHILLAFAIVTQNCTLEVMHSQHLEYYNQVLKIKEKNPNLKVLISVTDGSTGNFAKIIASKSNRATFAHSVLEFLQTYKLDGVDIDWEFPGWPGDQRIEEKKLFRKLLQQLYYTLKGDFLLTLAVAAPGPIIDRAYEIKFIARVVDFVSVMAYDYHSYIWYLPVLGPNAPLYSSRVDRGYFSSLNSNWSINYYLHKGMPSNKILLGLPTYGHSFTLQNPDSTEYGMPAKDYGKIGRLGFVSYDEVVQFLKDVGTTEIFDGDTKVPYAYRGDQWISFDNEQSLAYKTEYLMSKGLAGAMVWCLNTDDYEGRYHKEPFPLVKRIKTVLKDDDL